MEEYKSEKRGAGSMERDERFRLMRFVLFLMTVVSLTTIPLLPTCAQTQYGEDNKYYLLFNVNSITNGARGLIDREQDSGRDIDLMVLMKTFSQAWSLIGDDNGFQLKKTHDRYIAWNNDSKRYIVTSDAQRAAMFKVIKQGNNSYLQRVGAEGNKVVVPNEETTGSYFTDGNIQNKGRLFITKATLDLNAFDTSTENNLVIHRQSYLADRADAIPVSFPAEFMQKDQGWKELPNGERIQNTSEYYMTRYVKRGVYSPLYLSSSNKNDASKHIWYQRWYLRDDATYEETPLTTDYYLPEAKCYAYRNGLVMGSKMKKSSLVGDIGNHPVTVLGRIPEGYQGDTLTIQGDISRYMDFSYVGNDLKEASITFRHVYTLIDANVMARQLTALPAGQDNWLEEHSIHFPSETICNRDEFVPLNLNLENYWFYKDGIESEDNLQNVVNNDYVTYELEDHGSGISLIGFENSPECNRAPFITDTKFKRRRLLRFRYPSGYKVPSGSYAVFKVYAREGNNSTRRYQLARFTIIFDDNSETLYYKDVVGDDATRSERSPQSLRELCDGNDPVAHIDFDYPKAYYYAHATGGAQGNFNGMDFRNSSALPLQPSMTNYAFGPVTGSWGSYGIAVNENYQWDGKTPHHKMVPVSKYTGEQYSSDNDAGFLYIDASDMPGTVANIKFNGTFCMGSRLMCSGWIAAASGVNSGSASAPGGVILHVIGKKDGEKTVLYSFCPGQIDNNTRRQGTTQFFRYDKNNYEVLWHQFFFDFVVNELYDEYELDIENNCYQTDGGDYLLDDVWVFAKLPKVRMVMTSPLCGGQVAVMKLETDFESLLSSQGKQEATGDAPGISDYLCCVFLDRTEFYNQFRENLMNDHGIVFDDTDEFMDRVNAGAFNDLIYFDSYKQAFDQALMKVDVVDDNGQVTGQRIPYANFEWTTNFGLMEPYTFKKMVEDEEETVFATTENGIRKLVFNGTMGIDTWEDYKSYTLLTIQPGRRLNDDDVQNFARMFNLLDECSNQSYFKLLPKIEIVGHMGKQSLDEVTFCLNTTQTFAVDLAGYTYNDEGDEADYVLDDVNFDWWIGTDSETPGTVAEYKKATNADGTIHLYEAMKRFRLMNPTASDLYTDIQLGAPDLYPDLEFTQEMLDYLRSLANPADNSQPRLLLNTKLLDINLSEDYIKIMEEPNLDGGTDHFVYACAIPIETQIESGTEDYIFICSDPQPVKIKVDGVAPSLNTGFSEKHYPDKLGTLSVRISKSQFEKVHRRNKNDATPKKLHVPLRGVHLANPDDALNVMMAPEPERQVVLLTASTDPIMQQYIIDNYDNLLPPVVGTLTYLKATPGITNVDEEECVKMFFNENFNVREGYSYSLRFPFIENMKDGSTAESCEGFSMLELKIVPDYEVWTGAADNDDWSNDENWRRADFDELYGSNGLRLSANEQADNYYMTNDVNYVSAEDRERRQGFAPLYCTNVLMMTKEKAEAPWLYDDGDEVDSLGVKTGFPALRPTSSPIIRYDFQTFEWTQEYENAPETSAKAKQMRDVGDMITELYSTNRCDGIVFQPHTELVHTELLNYKKAWVEYELAKNQWHLVGSPLKDMLSAEWYAPTWSARQETTYFEDVQFDVTNNITMQNGMDSPYPLNYDRFAPAVYQRAWDKAKAVIYEKGAEWSQTDGSQTENYGDSGTGQWVIDGVGYNWDNTLNADEYLQRIVYKPMGKSKANVAVKGSWSGVYNDHSVPFDSGGFSVMPINHFKSHNNEEKKTVFRLPKEDQYYDIWDWSKGYSMDRRVRIYIDDGSDPTLITQHPENTLTLNNRGRLRTDDITPENQDYMVTLKNEGNGSLGYFLACNPFICGLDMQKFFDKNPHLSPYYLMLKDNDIQTDTNLMEQYQQLYGEGKEWKWTDVVVNGMIDGEDFKGTQIVPARYAFFVRTTDADKLNETTITFTTDMMVRKPKTETPDDNPARPFFLIKAQRAGNRSEARVIVSPDASNTFRPEEDMETFLVSDITSDIPVVYTLTGQMATSINRLHNFTCLPIGVESNSNENCVLTFTGVDHLSPLTSHPSPLLLYDAYLETSTPIEEGMSVCVPGQTQNRFFLVCGNPQVGVAESKILIYDEGNRVHVVSTTTAPLTAVRAYDATGRLVYADTPDKTESVFQLPKGVFVIEAATAANRKVQKQSVY